MRRLILLIIIGAFGNPVTYVCRAAPVPQPMRLGVDADNWRSQVQNPKFEEALRRMKIDFISWHIQPEEEDDPKRLGIIAQFCRKNHWSYLFNTEVFNYRYFEERFKHPDGTVRWDLAERTLVEFKDDPLFLGVVYDEADLVQALCGTKDGKGKEVPPYFADTRKLTASEAFLAVSAKVAELTRRYQSYGKRLIVEMTFPDYPFAFARGGALVAPKLLKENYNDLMYAVYRGAALEYHSPELWACIDLWFLDKFPIAGKFQPGYHTPAHLYEALQFAYSAGFDFAYIERVQALVNESFELTAYGDKVVEFQRWRESHKQGDWRTAPVDYYVKRFPDGYWGQQYSYFIPDHPYGSWVENPYRKLDQAWLKTLHDLSNGSIPLDANNWNASSSPYFGAQPYHSIAGLPAIVVFDHFGVIPPQTKAKVLDFSPRATGHQ